LRGGAVPRSYNVELQKLEDKNDDTTSTWSSSDVRRAKMDQRHHFLALPSAERSARSIGYKELMNSRFAAWIDTIFDGAIVN